jgi:hypothetical protein
MKPLFKSLLVLPGLLLGSPAQADQAACGLLMSARVHLLAVVGARDLQTIENHVVRVHEQSDNLDAALAQMAQSQNPEEAAKAKAFRPVWEAFKATREQEIIPAARAGKNDKARTLAMGIQAERRKKMRDILGCK